MADTTENTEFLLSYYRTAREDILLHIKMQERIYLVCLTVLAAFVGYVIQKENAYAILLIIPWFLLGGIYLLHIHQLVVAALVNYLQNEWTSILPNSLQGILHWENSRSRTFLNPESLSRYALPHHMFFTLPIFLIEVYVLYKLCSHDTFSANFIFISWIFTLIPLGFSSWFPGYTERKRQELNKSIRATTI
ncbi:MAG: hypothetical protein MUP17_06815 [candidate division Zixibacteria bacterium]|nr:hypothetical protein [candidate division Zixibacteria bacterium]